ncbi:MAG: hypothetical protein IKI67_04690 [Bacteroidales bacterium]|nr:hypothetical protein [Bacteroidales bacterium]
MKGFIEITAYEAVTIAGGKDADVSRFVELLGYGIGLLVRAVRNFRRMRNGQQVTEPQSSLVR